MEKNAKYGVKWAIAWSSVSWELNESLQNVAFRHKNNGLHMRKSNLSLLIVLHLLTEASF